MTVDGAARADRLRSLVPEGSPAAQLVDQLHDGMSDPEYAAIAVGIVRSLSRPNPEAAPRSRGNDGRPEQ